MALIGEHSYAIVKLCGHGIILISGQRAGGDAERVMGSDVANVAI